MKITGNKMIGFTLIEMLAVMFIICIIFSIALPAFGPMIRTLKLKTAAEDLANVLESARQYAITSGVNCYVVFPTSITDPIYTNMNYRAYKIYKPDTDPAPAIDTSTTIGKWEFLPNGIQIDSTCSFIGTPPGSDPSDPVPPPTYNSTNINFPEDTNTTTQSVRYIDFKPNGAATLNRTIGLTANNTNLIQEIVFYNQPLKIKVKDVSEK